MHSKRGRVGCIVWHMHSLDAVDARILLAKDSFEDASLIELGKRLGLSRNTIHARLKKIREANALGTASVALSPASLGRPLLAFVTLSVSQQSIDSVDAASTAIPGGVEAHTTTGGGERKARLVATEPEG